MVNPWYGMGIHPAVILTEALRPSTRVEVGGGSVPSIEVGCREKPVPYDSTVDTVILHFFLAYLQNCLFFLKIDI